MMKLDQKANSLKDILVKKNTVISNNFSFKEIKYNPPKNLLTETYDLIFHSKNGRSLKFCILRDIRGNDNINVTLYNDLCNIKDHPDTYDLSEQSLYLDEWLKKHNKLTAPDPFDLSSYSGDFSAQAKGFSDFLTSIFESPEFNPIITGQTWEIVPFDWMGMK